MPAIEQPAPSGEPDLVDWDCSSVQLSECSSREGTGGGNVICDFQRYRTTEDGSMSDTSTHSADPDVTLLSKVERTAHKEAAHKEQRRHLAEVIALKELKEDLDGLPTIDSVLEWVEGRSEVQRVIYLDHLAHRLEYGQYLTTVYETLEEWDREGEQEQGEGGIGEEPRPDQDGGERRGSSSTKVLANALLASTATWQTEGRSLDEGQRRRGKEALEGALKYMMSRHDKVRGRTARTGTSDTGRLSE